MHRYGSNRFLRSGRNCRYRRVKNSWKLGNDAMTNIRFYEGGVYPVNPSTSGSVYGYEFVESVHDIDADLALCCVPSPSFQRF
jgi:acyl-CoA synthetase (NDP forming)